MHSFGSRNAGKKQYVNTRTEKLNAGIAFIRSISTLPIRFAGVSGSVSYEPLPEDDIDIFIITEDRRLWITAAVAMLKRRLSSSTDICLCLFMSESYARRFFREQNDPLITEDSLHTVPVIGTEFFRQLLGQSEYIRRTNPEFAFPRAPMKTRVPSPSPLDLMAYLLLGSFLKMKGFIVNRKLTKSGRSEERFRTRISTEYMILDSLKYRKLRNEFRDKGVRAIEMPN